MSALRTLARRWRRLGWPGVLGAVLLAGGAIFYLAVLRPGHERLDVLRERAQAQRQQSERDQVQREEGNTPAGQLERFHQAFPAAASLPERLDTLFAVANRQGIHLDQGDYQLTRNAAGKQVRILIALPVRSDYPQIRKFIASLKTEIPALAVEHVQFERQKVADPTLEATLKLALYLEASP